MRLLFALASGIVVFQYWDIFKITRLVWLFIALILIAWSFWIWKSRQAYRLRWLFGAGIFILLFLWGFQLAESADQKSIFPCLNTKAIFVATLSETPVEKPNSLTCKLLVISMYDSINFVKINAPAILYVEKYDRAKSLKKGDSLLLRTTFQRPSRPLNPESFNYAAFLQRKGIGATAYVSAQEWLCTGNHQKFSLMSLAEASRNYLLQLYRKIELSKNEMAVLSALTLGYKDELEPELREDFSYAGVMHILAVSGLHVGVIYMMLQLIFSIAFRRAKSKILSTLFTLCALWLYAFMTGLPPSVIRATTMFSLVAIGTTLNRKSQIYNTISVSAFIILLGNPNLLFDVGFQLSYTAVIGIVYFQPKINSLFKVKHRKLKWLTDLMIVSLAAQIGTLPLSLYYFHQFPNYFLVTNIIVIPLASMIIYLAIGFLILSPLPFLAAIPAFILKLSLWLLNAIVGFVHDLPHVVSVWHINFPQLILCLLSIISFCFYLEYKKFGALFTSLCLTLIFTVSHLLISFNTFHTQQLVIYADPKNTHIDFIKGFNHQIYTTDSASAVRNASGFWKSHKLNEPKMISKANSSFIIDNHQKILILTDSLLHRKTTTLPLEIDILIIGNGLKFRTSEILNCIHPKICVIDQTISPWYAQDLQQFCLKNKIKCYDVKKCGAVRIQSPTYTSNGKTTRIFTKNN
ncbi:MAG: ComEC family competence protein [Bacteroidetes bacterium ADurb.Bin174]|nr:MAG: ComEC family competence protein [Bacteroidetes bacterium ADurb.Bin174]